MTLLYITTLDIKLEHVRTENNIIYYVRKPEPFDQEQRKVCASQRQDLQHHNTVNNQKQKFILNELNTKNYIVSIHAKYE